MIKEFKINNKNIQIHYKDTGEKEYLMEWKK